MLKYVRVQSGDALPDISNLKPFKALVIIEEDISHEWQSQACKWLVDSGCLYMMAWGHDCGSWDDMVDWSNLEQWDFGEIPKEASVMTTWHEEQPIDEVFFFAKHAAVHSTVKLDNLLIFHIGTIDKEAEFESKFLKA